MRMFRAPQSLPESGPPYRCQDDGMVGLGCGARSYAADLHYSSAYAVRAAGVRAIIDDYVSRPDASFSLADHGFRLGPEDQRRRFVIQSLLSGEGLSFDDYALRFGTDVRADLPQLSLLTELDLTLARPEGLTLTGQGVERSDVIGPWLYSQRVRTLMEGYLWT
jgi:oxygen-independent coproporphyrinogen III oxidase